MGCEVNAFTEVPHRRGWVVMLLLDQYVRDARVEKEAATLVRGGHRVTVLAWNRFGTSPLWEQRDGSEIERVGISCPSGVKWRMLLRLPRVYWWYFRRARAIPYDLLIAHDILTWPLGWVLRLLKRRRTIFDAHEPYAEQLVGILPYARPLELGFRWLEGFLARRADAVMTVTPRMVERYRGMRVRELFYLPNVPMANPEAVWKPTGRPDRLTIGRIGSITPNYSGVEPLLEVGKALYAAGAPVRVMIGGPVLAGWEPEFRRRIAECGQFAEYLGVVPVTQVLAVVRQFDFMLSLRDLRPRKAAVYGYSTKIFEAMACGVPVLSTAAGEDYGLVQETGCGEIVPFPVDAKALADRLVDLWRDEACRRRYGENGLRAVRAQHRWQSYESAFLAFSIGQPLAAVAPAGAPT